MGASACLFRGAQHCLWASYVSAVLCQWPTGNLARHVRRNLLAQANREEMVEEGGHNVKMWVISTLENKTKGLWRGGRVHWTARRAERAQPWLKCRLRIVFIFSFLFFFFFFACVFFFLAQLLLEHCQPHLSAWHAVWHFLEAAEKLIQKSAVHVGSLLLLWVGCSHVWSKQRQKLLAELKWNEAGFCPKTQKIQHFAPLTHRLARFETRPASV